MRGNGQMIGMRGSSKRIGLRREGQEAKYLDREKTVLRGSLMTRRDLEDLTLPPLVFLVGRKSISPLIALTRRGYRQRGLCTLFRPTLLTMRYKGR